MKAFELLASIEEDIANIKNRIDFYYQNQKPDKEIDFDEFLSKCSGRLQNLIRLNDCSSMQDIINMSIWDWKRSHNFGKQTLLELQGLLWDYNLTLRYKNIVLS